MAFRTPHVRHAERQLAGLVEVRRVLDKGSPDVRDALVGGDVRKAVAKPAT